MLNSSSWAPIGFNNKDNIIWIMEIINIIIAVNLKFVVEMILPNSTGINIPITDWVVFFLNSYTVRS